MNLVEAEEYLTGRIAAKHITTAALEATIRAHLFEQQRHVLEDLHRFITVCAGRRAGKTYAVAAMMLGAACRHPNRTVLYLHLTREGAKGIIWPTLKILNQGWRLHGKVNESALTITMPNGAVIALRGVDKRKEIEKFRGYGFALVVIDECQSIPEYVRKLVDDVIGPALADVPGRLVMIGTPSMLESGYWFECHHNRNADGAGQEVWGHHSWTMWENPFISDAEGAFLAECARRGVEPDDISMQREWKGRWIRDAASAVFAFDAARNTFRGELPVTLDPTLWKYVIAVDIGGGVERDNDAVVVLAFHPNHRATWLIEEHIDGTQDVTSLAEVVKGIRDRLGRRNVVAIVADTGGLGAKVTKEMTKRHRLAISAAKKQEKWSNIAVLNAACRRGEFLAPVKSAFATESVKVEKDWEKSTPDRIEIKGHMPDICDSVLYGYVASLAWNAKPAPPTEDEKRAELQAVVKRAATPKTPEQLDAEARGEMQRYSHDLARERRQRERTEAIDFGAGGGRGWGGW